MNFQALSDAGGAYFFFYKCLKSLHILGAHGFTDLEFGDQIGSNAMEFLKLDGSLSTNWVLPAQRLVSIFGKYRVSVTARESRTRDSPICSGKKPTSIILL